MDSAGACHPPKHSVWLKSATAHFCCLHQTFPKTQLNLWISQFQLYQNPDPSIFLGTNPQCKNLTNWDRRPESHILYFLRTPFILPALTTRALLILTIIMGFQDHIVWYLKHLPSPLWFLCLWTLTSSISCSRPLDYHYWRTNLMSPFMGSIAFYTLPTALAQSISHATVMNGILLMLPQGLRWSL